MGIGEFPQQAENRFRVTKALLAEEFDSLTKRLINAKIKEKSQEGCLMSLGEAIRITRQKSFYTQEEFAQKLNVALSTVNRWELNKAKPSVKAMRAIKSFCEEIINRMNSLKNSGLAI